ncbi:MAG: RHS repeat-associated core domain-containing protein, partial [Bacteroidales bacterium]
NLTRASVPVPPRLCTKSVISDACPIIGFSSEIKISSWVTHWQTRYTFSAKEKDKNTGYHYFGARYYDSEVSVWLSVDPLTDHAPSWSPYNYVWGNPIINIDPDGRWGENKAKRKHERAVEKYGSDRVGDVTKYESSKEWGFKVYKSAEDKAKDGKKVEGSTVGGAHVWNKGDRIESRSSYKKYKKANNEPLVYGPTSSSRKNIAAKMRSFDRKLDGANWSEEFRNKFEKVTGFVVRQATVLVFPPLKIYNLIYSVSRIPCEPQHMPLTPPATPPEHIPGGSSVPEMQNNGNQNK